MRTLFITYDKLGGVIRQRGFFLVLLFVAAAAATAHTLAAGTAGFVRSPANPGATSTIPTGEVGENDFQISHMGQNGNVNYDAISPAVAYNSADNQYLVVWAGDDDTGTLVNNEVEIFGQLLDGAGREIRGDFRISDMGPDGDINYDAWLPAVVFNTRSVEYLVVWYGNDDSGELVEGETEIFGQRLDYWGEIYFPYIRQGNGVRNR